MILTLIIFSNIMILMVLSVFINRAMIERLQDIFHVDAPYQLLLPTLIVAEFIGLFIVGMMALIMSHRIAGPIYRLKMELKEIGKGDLSRTIKFRDKDEFKDVAVAVNTMLGEIRQKLTGLSHLRDNVKKLHGQYGSTDVGSDLRRIEQKLDETLSSLNLT